MKGLGSRGNTRERKRTVGLRMVPAALYQRIRTDQTIREAAELLLSVQMHPMSDDDTDRGRRALLVFDGGGVFRGLIRAQDIVQVIVSEWRASSEADAAAGVRIGDVVRPLPAIDVHATVMQAAARIAADGLSHLAVTRRGKLVGLLRPEDLYQEVVSPGPAG